MDYYFRNGELYHGRNGFKYIKRQWVNGRWRYWYPETKNKLTDHSGHLETELKYNPGRTSRNPEYGRLTRARYNVRKDIEDVILRNLKDPTQAKYREHDRKTLELTRREKAAYAQELDRIEADRRNKKLKNRAKKWLSKVFSTKKTIKDSRTGKTIKTWTTSGWSK